MRKYVQDAGYQFKADYNDMPNKHFTLTNIEYANSDLSTLGNLLLDRVETYMLFTKDIDPKGFKTTLESILNNALSAGVKVSLQNSIQVVKEENGYKVTLVFYIQ